MNFKARLLRTINKQIILTNPLDFQKMSELISLKQFIKDFDISEAMIDDKYQSKLADANEIIKQSQR